MTGAAARLSSTLAPTRATVAATMRGLPPAVVAGRSGRTCQNRMLPARASPSSVKKPTTSTTTHSATEAPCPQAACSSITLPMKPGSGGRPAALAAASSSSRPSSTGWATADAGSSRPPASPRCAPTSSASKNSPATTSVLFSR